MKDGLVSSNEVPQVPEVIKGLKGKKAMEELLKGLTHIESEVLDKILVILLDCSGSMRGYMENTSKIEVAWNILKDELAPNLAGWNYGILRFSSTVSWEVYPTDSPQGLVLADRPMAIGGTCMRQALETVWEWVRVHTRQARFILLSDGCPTDSNPSDLLDMARRHTSIPIDTVGIGSLVSGEYDENFLKELARLTGGVFVKAHSVKALASAIRRLSPAERPMLGEARKGE